MKFFACLPSRLLTILSLLAATIMTQTNPRSGTAADSTAKNFYTYVGTYTNGGKSKGIYVLKFDASSGKLTPHSVAEGVKNPSFLAIHPSNKFLYAVGEIDDFGGKKAGGVSAFAINSGDGNLRLLNQQSSGGTGPCHLNVDEAGKNVLVANYGGGSVACLPIGDDGKLRERSAFIQHTGKSVDTGRQEAPHAHSINLDRANKFAFVADLGLDKVLVYKFDYNKGSLTPNDPPAASVEPGSGPRHFAFHPSGKFAYVINEMALTVTAFQYDPAHGTLKTLQTISTIPDSDRSQKGMSTAEIRVHPSGKFLYGSNRGHNTIAAFAIDSDTGKLTYLENESTQGKTPRNFFIDPTGAYLLAENQDSDSIVVFGIDAKTGKLEATGEKLEVPSPVCIRMMPVK